jgi:hypothetical protein
VNLKTEPNTITLLDFLGLYSNTALKMGEEKAQKHDETQIPYMETTCTYYPFYNSMNLTYHNYKRKTTLVHINGSALHPMLFQHVSVLQNHHH